MSSARVSAVLLGLLLLVAARVDAGTVVSVDTNTPYIPADGKSYAQILVTVLEQTGASAPDGTEVRLTTSAGDITPVVYTSGGRAIGILTASTLPQVATINAIVNGISGSVQVEYTTPSGEDEAATGGRTIRMTGGSLAYCVEQDTVVGSNSVTLEYRGMTIHAASIQVNQSSGQIRAQGDVSVSRDDSTLAADELAIDMRSDRFHTRNSSDKSDVRTFDIGRLEPAKDSAKVAANGFNPLLNVNGRTWIQSRRLVLIPTQKILFYKATIYVGESKVVSMPYYCYSYRDREAILQQVHYTSNDGMLVDLPFYYRMNESNANAIKLRYAASGSETGGYARPRKGMSLGLQNDYLVGNAGRGTMFVDSVGSSSQAYELAHHLDYGSALTNGRADFSARFQPSSSYARNIYSTTLNMSGSLPNYNYSVLGYFGGSRIRQSLVPGGYLAQSNCSLRTVIRSKKTISSSQFGRIMPSLTVGYGTPSGSLSSCLYQTLGLNSSRTRQISSRVSTGLDGFVGYTMTAAGDTGSEMRLRPSLRTSWVGGSATLNYTLNLKGGLNSRIYSQGVHQIGSTVDFDLGSRLNCSSTVDFGLDSKRMNLYSTMRFRASKLWQIRSSYDLYQYTYELNSGTYSYRTSYLRVGLYRPVGVYEVGLVWSPDGQDYGINQGKHLWLELSGMGF